MQGAGAAVTASRCQRNNKHFSSGFSGKACTSLLLLAVASSPRVGWWKGGKAKGTELKETEHLKAQGCWVYAGRGMAVWSYLLGEGEGVGEHREEHCSSLWCIVTEAQLLSSAASAQDSENKPVVPTVNGCQPGEVTAHTFTDLLGLCLI